MDLWQTLSPLFCPAHILVFPNAQVNTSVDNIGARRLHTVLERILDEISFQAPQKVSFWAADFQTVPTSPYV